MNTLGDSLSIIQNEAILEYIFKGVVFTLFISVVAVGIGLVFGSVLALIRNYAESKGSFVSKIVAKVFRFLAIAYIEIFRNTPLLLWIFICIVFFPTPEGISKKMFGLTSVEVKLMLKAMVALILFTSSVIAEIVRGGLNSVEQGQFEAGYSQGFNMIEVMIYIILPQAYRNIVPTLLSQVVTTIKDSSYLANVAVIELMSRMNILLSTSYKYNGTGKVNVSDVLVLFGVAAIIYFSINFTLSSIVRYMQSNSRIPKALARD